MQRINQDPCCTNTATVKIFGEHEKSLDKNIALPMDLYYLYKPWVGAALHTRILSGMGRNTTGSVVGGWAVCFGGRGYMIKIINHIGTKG
ncbi:MAG: hypothetical protein HQM04_18720 [Magnetococcales bacterium]|nr:hypothetical protein [Magnetococcales bacterium]MBF0117064.1 hypothetical protein [Magnetococcales bacterium]